MLSLLTIVYATYPKSKKALPSPYTIYNNTGKAIAFQSMIKELTLSDVCLMGEFHNDPIAHWLELRILKALHALQQERLMFGGEMWERDIQSLTDECLKDKLISIETYTESSKQWKNFATDYQPLLEFCREKSIPFHCTNVPRRYANLVAQQGDSILYNLSKEATAYLPALPIAFNFSEKSYVNFAKMMKMDGMHAMKKSSVENLIKAQAVKDATMAHWITQKQEKGKLFFHINGDFHSAYHSGINYYLKIYNPKLSVKTISVQYESEGAPDFTKGDYNIVIARDIPKSY